jgi:hypothetical protein
MFPPFSGQGTSLGLIVVEQMVYHWMCRSLGVKLIEDAQQIPSTTPQSESTSTQLEPHS